MEKNVGEMDRYVMWCLGGRSFVYDNVSLHFESFLFCWGKAVVDAGERDYDDMLD